MRGSDPLYLRRDDRLRGKQTLCRLPTNFSLQLRYKSNLAPKARTQIRCLHYRDSRLLVGQHQPAEQIHLQCITTITSGNLSGRLHST